MQPTMRPVAQAVQSQGRGKDTMLVHMTPNEVAGLQALAMQHGGSLTINPKTGLPEADFLESILPMILGFALGPAGFGLMSAGGAGLTVGGATTLLTGDLGKGLMAGLGAFGGGNLGAGLMEAGTAAGTTSGAVGSSSATAAELAGTQSAAETARLTAANAQAAATTPPPTFMDNLSQAGRGLKNILTGEGDAFGKFIGNAADDKTKEKATGLGGTMGAIKTVGALASPALVQQPASALPASKDEKSNYEWPYTPTPREVRFPTAEDRARIGTSEFTYFTPSNPVPGFQPYSATQNAQPTPMALAQPVAAPMMTEEEKKRQMLNAIGGLAPSSLGTGMKEGGIAALARGRRETRKGMPPRFLAGGGDGMSDSIPAVIDNKQPARLADGEFVVPADVVSHLGNGSSKAGAKKLYAMMDRVRQARTGRKRQAPEINMRRMMPA